MIKKISLLLLAIGSLTSCVAVKNYEKVYLNDPDMVLAAKKVSKFETSFQVYREAASGANGGKVGGGCGCN
ncbi:DUF4266 domain-containing protein [Lutibacter sp.]|uniref:DUF4266 domain-containing protein n=1 Tax=Lutibacter sp. TaxID=1925666 RepID=UPI0025B7F140|nr:DUF4266 domain-containing protein [Lutibacter sp.]MCF6167379.1 DUF4266 domain-containing protein [Lutibacter sp.]